MSAGTFPREGMLPKLPMEPQVDGQQFKEEWLADIVEGNPSTVELGNRFAHKLLTQWRDMEATNADVTYCDGSGDGGIDAAFLEIDVDTGTTLETHTWYLVQIDVDDLYAAFHLQQAADTYHFGRTGPATRYLFYHLVIEFLRGLLIRSSLVVSRRTLTAALNQLFAAGQQVLLLDTAIEALDEYLTPGTDNSIYDEPQLKRINHNLHAYLKSEQIGKGEIYKRLIADYVRQLGKGKPSPREILIDLIKDRCEV